ncbi:MAG: DUF368 domain-containing protein [Porticoccaceae bacterium]|nr:DUF368 domain-containing protein [Porticoccaceae bacterium]
MGAADVVPGVSGGTIAFISGIYDELVESLRSLGPDKLRWLGSGEFGEFWRRVNGAFLSVLVAGILTSVFTLAHLVDYSLQHYPLLVWAFFFGLVIASIIYVGAQLPRGRLSTWIGLGIGTALASASAFAPAVDLGNGPVTVFCSGMLAICAMILPGISGSFILLMIGMYPVLIDAITRVDAGVLSLFAAGAVVGLMVFSRLLSWLLHHHRSATLAILTGFLVGSLAVLWPWRLPASGPSGVVDQSLGASLMLPSRYGAQVGDPQVLACVLLMAAGLVLVLGLEYLGSVLKHRIGN